ncbi:hypothetical protein MHYP_G00313990 [Metynnis hypsauchen]
MKFTREPKEAEHLGKESKEQMCCFVLFPSSRAALPDPLPQAHSTSPALELLKSLRRTVTLYEYGGIWNYGVSDDVMLTCEICVAAPLKVQSAATQSHGDLNNDPSAKIRIK